MDADRRPSDDEYYQQHRTGLFSQGDLFRDVPLAYPTFLHELTEPDEDDADVQVHDRLSAGKRRFLSGPLDFGHAMLITPTCAMSAQGASGYAHPVRTLVVVRAPLARQVLRRRPLPPVRRQQQLLLRITRQELLRHDPWSSPTTRKTPDPRQPPWEA